MGEFLEFLRTLDGLNAFVKASGILEPPRALGVQGEFKNVKRES
jgi:hypothetical protein